HALRTLLTDRFVIHDRPADKFGGARRCKKHFPVSAPAVLSRLDSERVKSFCQCRGSFVGRKNPFPLDNQILSDALKAAAPHADPPIIFYRLGNGSTTGLS